MRRGNFRSAMRVDRDTIWGNPYRIGRDGTRSDVLLAHEDWLRDDPAMVLETWRLRGHSLACWCDPQPCHGWLLFYVANCTDDQHMDWILGERFWTPDMLKWHSVPGAPGCWRKLDGDL